MGCFVFENKNKKTLVSRHSTLNCCCFAVCCHYVLQGSSGITYWPFKTDGPSYAHWIYPYKHLLPLSCMTASCVNAEEKLVSASKSWPGKWWHHPREVTWGILSPYCTCSLGLRISTECTHTQPSNSVLSCPSSLACCHLRSFAGRPSALSLRLQLIARLR